MLTRIHLVGDVMIGRSFNERLSQDPQFNIWGDLPSLFRPGEPLLGNLETTITHSEDPWPRKAFNFKLNPQYAEVLKGLPFRYLSLANNHILDYKVEGMIETIETLDRLGITHAGAGMNLKEAQRPVILPLENGVNLHIISAADHYRYWAATPTRPGIFWFNLDDPSDLVNAVAEYARGLRAGDLLMVSLHWGPNWEPQPSRQKRNLARKLVDAGAKIIHGHSAHHLQPYEIINGSVVFYSMGDFIDDYAIDPRFRNDIGGIATLEVNSRAEIVRFELHKTLINDLQVNLM